MSSFTLLHMPRKVQVCVLTYKRPGMLADALASVHAQTGLRELGIHLHLLVIDNDPLGSGYETFASFADPVAGLTRRYVLETSRGLAYARNRALAESADMDLVAFLDDDEVAAPEWLSSLVSVRDRFNADVVSGPVMPIEHELPDWIVEGGFLNAAERNTGAPLQHVATDNVLLHAPVFRHFRFDPRFNQTGGEDTDFFLRVHAAGLLMVWAAEARVATWVPKDRANARWLISRAYSDASRYTHARLLLSSGSIGTRAVRVLRALGGAVAGAALLVRAPFGKRYSVQALRLMARSAGTFSALVGMRQHYYGAAHE